MTRNLAFAQGVGTGAGVVLVVGVLLILTRARQVADAARRLDEASRAGKLPWTVRPPNYLDLCRAAGL